MNNQRDVFTKSLPALLNPTLRSSLRDQVVISKIYLICNRKVMLDGLGRALPDRLSERVNGIRTDSRKIYVPVNGRRTGIFEVATCDLKERQGWKKVARLHSPKMAY